MTLSEFITEYKPQIPVVELCRRLNVETLNGADMEDTQTIVSCDDKGTVLSVSKSDEPAPVVEVESEEEPVEVAKDEPTSVDVAASRIFDVAKEFNPEAVEEVDCDESIEG